MEQSLKQQNEERALAVLQARRAGSTLVEVAIQQGISRERVRQLECRGLEIEIERASSDPQYELPVRTRNCVLNGGCPAVVPELVAAHFKSVYELSRIPNMGKLTIKNLQEWLIRHGQKPIPGSESYKPPPAPSVVAAKMMDEQMSALLARALPYVQRAGAIELAVKIKFALGWQC